MFTLGSHFGVTLFKIKGCNMKKELLMSVLAVGVLAITGCGSNDDSEGDSGSCNTTLTGTWTQHTVDTNGGVSNTTIQFDNCQLKLIGNSSSGINFTTSGTHEETGSKTVQPNNVEVTKITSTINSAQWTPTTEDITNTLNVNAVCGFTDWAINVPKELTGSECNKGNQVNKDIYLITSNSLMFGDDSNGSDGYPEALDPTDIWTKK